MVKKASRRQGQVRENGKGFETARRASEGYGQRQGLRRQESNSEKQGETQATRATKNRDQGGFPVAREWQEVGY